MSDPHMFKRKKHRRGKRAGRKNRESRFNRRVPPNLVVVTSNAVHSAAPVSPAVILSLRKRLAAFTQRRSA